MRIALTPLLRALRARYLLVALLAAGFTVAVLVAVPVARAWDVFNLPNGYTVGATFLSEIPGSGTPCYDIVIRALDSGVDIEDADLGDDCDADFQTKLDTFIEGTCWFANPSACSPSNPIAHPPSTTTSTSTSNTTTTTTPTSTTTTTATAVTAATTTTTTTTDSPPTPATTTTTTTASAPAPEASAISVSTSAGTTSTAAATATTVTDKLLGNTLSKTLGKTVTVTPKTKCDLGIDRVVCARLYGVLERDRVAKTKANVKVVLSARNVKRVTVLT